MLKDITLGQYIPGKSFLHRADPRVKILMSLFFMVLIFIINSYLGLIILSLFTLFAVAASDLPLGMTLRGLKPILFILLFTAVINIFTVQGRPLFQFGIIHITYEGIGLTFKTTLRLCTLVVSASLLTLTTTPISLTDGIESLMKPLSKIGVPSHEIAMMMSIALRFIPTLLDETEKIMKAQSARGADFDTGNIIQRAKSFIPVLIPLFVSAFRRADELATAMEARCYRGSKGRTRMKQLKMTRADMVVSLVLIIFSAGVLAIEWI